MPTTKATTAKASAARRNGVQSIEVGAQLLEVLGGSMAPLHLRELAGGAGMSPSKARRYLVSLLRCGLVEQDRASGRYDLGPMALRVGLTALSRRHVVRVATEAVIDLNQEVDRTVMLSIWTERGPFVVAWYDSSEVIICNLNVGSTFPLLQTVTGRLFLSYLPRATTARLLAAELAWAVNRDGAAPIRSEADVQALIAELRRTRVAMTRELLVPGLSAVGAPVFDHEGRMVAAIAMIGSPGTIETMTPGGPAALLLEKADAVSRRLGCPAPAAGGSFAEWLEARAAGDAGTPPPALAVPAAPLVVPPTRRARKAG